jgi:cellulose synthase/poly-beta-1,6-N-acetylglucosamine synthase-like glycosyltransferase
VPAGGHLRLQLLDDSADETTTIAAAAVAVLAAEGVDVVHARRATRGGFKAGALAHGLALDGARKEGPARFAAIFDADFVPAPDFLEKTLPHLADPLVALVQARWEHLNRDESLLTRLQALFLDGHFVLESAVRFRAGLFFNFNGTAGVFRRAAIDDGGGWAGDTVTEDLDLSYRILLKGWRFVFLSDVTAPAEVPATMKDFKSQQARWTKGSIEVGRKLLPELLRAPLSRDTRLEAFIHLTNNVSYPLLVLLALLVVPSLEVRHDIGWMKLLWLDAPLFLVSSLSVGLFYAISQRELKRPWLRELRLVPMMMSLGIGMAVPNAVGVVEALCGRRTPFERTPKRGRARPASPYRTRLRPAAAAEGALLVYFAVALAWCAAARLWAAVPFVLVFFTGFLYNAVLSFWPTRR